ncbi:pentatricopeptide repeat-containing protein At1g32415, mitochondrial [Amborella trichopoda]|uniref:pentatricopeptide repeat-containing protein At1g32415, mitochondrial n=1 Tax=Amborella trichopoda TaxID=13333 RepID=UPI0009C01C4A|nr:pentatricopeptide repeat-containing protein At1g32415, mitochondrial [Amborella trichopoda]|eukprot:XP_011621721.2 pentatricopeptide repeat-containing protein At1g32415, mitochondrial [Amborella trichopoda]
METYVLHFQMSSILRLKEAANFSHYPSHRCLLPSALFSNHPSFLSLWYSNQSKPPLPKHLIPNFLFLQFPSLRNMTSFPDQPMRNFLSLPFSSLQIKAPFLNCPISELPHFELQDRPKSHCPTIHRLFDKNSKREVLQCTSAISRLARKKRIDEARKLFDSMPERNQVTWNAMLTAYINSGRIMDAFQLFKRMPHRNVVSWTAMLHGFALSGLIKEAMGLFISMPERNPTSWNAMISGLIHNHELTEARRLFDEMPDKNTISWNVMLSGYVESAMMGEARATFDTMPKPNVITWTSMVAGYCRSGNVSEARELFEQMPVKNFVSWTAMIGGYVWNGMYDDALLIFHAMRWASVKPNSITFISLFHACSGLGYVNIGKPLHASLMVNGLHDHDDERLSKSMIHMYSQFGIMDYAHYIFQKRQQNCTMSWNSLINGYAQHGSLREARRLFDAMDTRDAVSWTSMINGYLSAGDVDEACHLFEMMPMTMKDAISWAAMISGHVHNELFSEAMDLFSQMQQSCIKPLDHTYSSLLSACGSMAYLDQGRQFHARLIQTRPNSDIIINNSLVSMYAKCGSIDNSYKVFINMPYRDIISWNSMIMGFSHHGSAAMTVTLLDALTGEGLKPNSVTFLGILSACSHAGLMDDGWRLFRSMIHEHNIEPEEEHYICMIDLLGRFGRVGEALEFVQKMPFKPGLNVWGALLSICSIHKNVAIGKRAMEHVLHFDPLNAPAHVLLCNIYAANGRHDEETRLRKRMGHKGVRKYPGCSWILVKGRLHLFLAGDRSHPQIEKICEVLGGPD